MINKRIITALKRHNQSYDTPRNNDDNPFPPVKYILLELAFNSTNQYLHTTEQLQKNHPTCRNRHVG